MTTWLIFETKALADALTQDIAVTPSGVIFYCAQPLPDYGFDATPNRMGYRISADGRAAIGHPLTEADVDFFEAYLADEITAGSVAVTQTWPSDWADAEVVE